MIKVIFRPEDWEKHRTDEGSLCAIKIRKEIERLSPFELEPVGVAVEEGYIPDLEVASDDLDYAILYKGKRIAVIDTTCSNYTFKGSRIMPVRYYKGDIIKNSPIPTFMVYSMEKENRPLAERCVWIRGKDVIKCKPELIPTDSGRKLQDNYMTNKKDWHRGLRSLIDELLKIVEASKQTTLG